ncbi:hypothetical protein HAX54_045377, partial [Datura stramonium]|nr:hypothetical protein [Datura stramonium]
VEGHLAPAAELQRLCLAHVIALRRVYCRTKRPAPRAWNRAAQVPCRASGSAARPVPRASGRAAVL